MIAYLGLIAAQFILMFAVKLLVKDYDRQEKLIAAWGMLLLFLFLALKNETVGIDIRGYKEQFEISGRMRWGNYAYVYFEQGYTALSMLCAKLGMGFQLFTALLYAAWCYAVYLLIRKFSPNAFLSIIVFICYTFLAFSVTALRQTLAMTICLYAFFLCLRKGKLWKLLSLALIALAMYVHESAVVFFAIIALVMLRPGKVNILAWIGLTAGAVVFRNVIWWAVSLIYGKRGTAFDMGGSFIFLCGMVVFVAFSYWYGRNSVQSSGQKFHFDAFAVKAVFISVICYIIFSGGTLLRANMYYTMFLIPAIPNSISQYKPKVGFVLSLAMTVFMVILFITDTLTSNQLRLWPYEFFWQ